MAMVNEMEWQALHAQLVASTRKRDKAWRVFMDRTHKLAALAHPETGGIETLCRNWGNAESVRVWRDGWRRWQAVSAAYDRRYNAILRAMQGKPPLTN